jgi:hypothetical protein
VCATVADEFGADGKIQAATRDRTVVNGSLARDRAMGQTDHHSTESITRQKTLLLYRRYSVHIMIAVMGTARNRGRTGYTHAL